MYPGQTFVCWQSERNRDLVIQFDSHQIPESRVQSRRTIKNGKILVPRRRHVLRHIVAGKNMDGYPCARQANSSRARSRCIAISSGSSGMASSISSWYSVRRISSVAVSGAKSNTCFSVTITRTAEAQRSGSYGGLDHVMGRVDRLARRPSRKCRLVYCGFRCSVPRQERSTSANARECAGGWQL